MKFEICSNSIYISACDNLMSYRNYTLLMAKLAAAQCEKYSLLFSTDFI